MGVSPTFCITQRRSILNILQAILMGIVQGLTEFLPVSSSGHLAIFRAILNVNTEVSALFEALLHVGTLAAVFIVFWKDVKMLIIETLKLIRDAFLWIVKKQKIEIYTERMLSLLVIVASIPTAIIGLIVEIFLEDFLLSSLVAVGVGLLITGGLLLLMTKIPQGHKELKDMKLRDGIFMGLVQGIATVPGISRSGSTVTAGLFCGLDRDFAFRFSFLMSIPAILGATLLKLLKISATDAANIGSYLIGMVIAGVIGYFSLIWMRKLLKNWKFHYFGFYDLAMGLIVIVFGIFVH